MAGSHETESTKDLLSRANEVVRAGDGAALDDVLQQAVVRLSRPILIEGLVIPLLQQVGDSWQSGDLRIAHEHVASGVIRTFLGSLIHRAHGPAGAPQLVVATVSGQVHELGALVVAAVAVSHGWKVAYLGADLPAEEIAAMVSLIRMRAVAISLVYPAGDPAVAQEINRLRRYLPDSVPVLMGGRAASSYLHLVERSGIVYIEKIADLPKILAGLT